MGPQMGPKMGPKQKWVPKRDPKWAPNKNLDPWTRDMLTVPGPGTFPLGDPLIRRPKANIMETEGRLNEGVESEHIWMGGTPETVIGQVIQWHHFAFRVHRKCRHNLLRKKGIESAEE